MNSENQADREANSDRLQGGSSRSDEVSAGDSQNNANAPYMQQRKITGARAGGRKNFAAMSRVLPQVLRKLGLDQRLKEQTFMTIWPHVVGEPFGSLSRPIFIDHERNIVIAVRDASVGQEMTFSKPQLLKAIRQAARGVGIEISGMRFDLKRFSEKNPDQIPDILPDPSSGLPLPGAEDLDAVVLTALHLEEITALGQSYKNAQPEAPEELITRLKGLFEKELRLKLWRESQGYPRCNLCGDVTPRLHGTALICAQCYSSGMS